jgi:formamidase
MGRSHVSSRPLWLTENECLPVIVCGAIEMAGVITIKFTVMKDGMAQLGMKSPIYIPGPVEPQFGPGRYIYFEGFSVDEHGKQHYMDATVAYRQTSLRVIEYLRRYGKSLPGLSYKTC